MKMAEKKDGCDAEDQSRKVSSSSPCRDDRSILPAAIETTTAISMIKGSPSSRKRSPNHEEGDEEEEETHVETKRPKIPDEADQPTDITIHEGNPNNGQTQEEGEEDEEEEDDDGMFHPRVYKGILWGPSFYFEKKLRAWDVASDKNRLVIPPGYSCLALAMLRSREKREVHDEFLRVVTTDRNGAEYALGLKWIWRGGFVLINEWSKLVEANGLKKGDFIKIYRYHFGPHEELRFALHVIPKI